VGHNGPPRKAPEYHALVTLNAVLGGQFTSRLNRNLRETRGITYGARTSFDMRRRGGTFTCETSVQADRTAEAVTEVLAEMQAIQRDQAVVGEELLAAKASLTRGYVRHFETAAHLLRAAAQLVTYDLDEDTFDRFVPFIEAVGSDDLARAAQAFLRPDDTTIVVVGDASLIGASLETAGREIVHVTPEF
jgi:predicted Zn-dependent peptidase